MIYGILLAAGMSSRMGSPKQLLDWHGQPLIAHVVTQACNSMLDGLIVVTGAAAESTQAVLSGIAAQRNIPVSVCFNPVYAQGQATSLRAGIAELPAGVQAIVVLLVDQPLITPALINRLIAAYQADPTHLAVVPTYQGKMGNPALLTRPVFEHYQQLQGDDGARQLFAHYNEQILWLAVEDPAVVQDMDTPEVYRALRGA